ncbi:hypothetical protein V8C42DRAFT_326322 [Trichoderma barbatum]
MLSILSTCALLLAGSALALPSIPRADNSINSPYPVPPSPAPGCTDRSTKLTEWKVTDFDFHASYVFTTPAHQNSWGYVNFTLINPAANYTSDCSASSNQLQDFFYGNFKYSCNVPVLADTATFTFSRPDSQLRINQTWNCPGEGSRFTAIGGVDLKLKCEDTTWKNPNWTAGQIYSQRLITCLKATVPAPIEEMSAVL